MQFAFGLTTSSDIVKRVLYLVYCFLWRMSKYKTARRFGEMNVLYYHEIEKGS